MSPATVRLAVRSRPNDGSGLVLQDRKTADQDRRCGNL